MLRKTSHLTNPNPELDSKIAMTVPGMASWSVPAMSETCGM